MKKMINKYTIFTFILGILICGISVHAYSILASDVSYSSKDENWNVDNVGNAINDLYDNMLIKNMPTNSNYFMGNRTNYANTSLTLEKGKYLVFASSNYVSTDTVLSSSFYIDTSMLTISSSNCEKLIGKGYFNSATSKVATNTYARIYSYDLVWYCDINEEETITVTHNADNLNANVYPMHVRAYSVKLH